MSATVSAFGHRGTTSSVKTEIVRELVNATDGAGLHFDGGGYVSAGDTTVIDGATKLSVEVIAATTAADDGEMIAKAYDATALRFFVNSSGQVVFRVNNGSGNGTATSSGTVIDGNPTHIVGVWDGSTVKIYINGNEDGSAALSGGAVPNIADQLALGAQQKSTGATTNRFTGTLYRARIWNKAVDAKALFERADVDYADQYGSQTDLVNANSSGSGTAWTGASGGTAPNGWSPAGTSKTYTIDSGTGNPAPSLKITSTGSPNVGIKWGGTTVLGRRYQATFSYKCGDASTTLSYRLNDADSFVNLDNSTSWATKTVEWIGDGVTSAFMLRVNESGKFGHFDTVSIKSIGCVSDYDLAFANPKNSFKINDRSGAADGTASNDGTNPTGISQVQVIKQLNATAARIGTTAATPVDGQILTSGDIGVGGSPSTTASTSTIEAVNSGTARVLMKSTGTGGREYGLWTSTSGNLGFFDYTAGANRLTISSTGAVTVQGGTGDGDGNNAELNFQRTSSTGNVLETKLIFDDANTNYGDLVIKSKTTASSGGGAFTEAMRVYGANGIVNFNNGILFTQTDTSATGATDTSSTLDHYEEGTWTPIVRDWGGNEATLSTAEGVYTRIGRQVFLGFRVVLSSKGSMTGSYVHLAGLPFNHPSDSKNGSGYIDSYNNLAVAKSGLALDTSSTPSVFWLAGNVAGGGTGYHLIAPSDLTDTFWMKGGVSYSVY